MNSDNIRGRLTLEVPMNTSKYNHIKSKLIFKRELVERLALNNEDFNS